MIKKILIVDDHPFIINGLEKIISGINEFKIVATATNGQEAIEALQKHTVNIVFTDIEMPELGGLELIEHINSNYPDIRIVVLTMHSHHWMLKKILRLNVSAVLSKSAGDADFKSAVEAIAQNKTYYDENVQLVLDEDEKASGNRMGISIVSFTTREKQVLSAIYEGLTTKEISEKLHKSVHTIESHRKNLFLKCGVKNVTGLLKFALEKGLI